ncbi:hypothetical protein AOL_s00054g931 [Orbilia oligospora ATCC 24927]|uniref:FAD-binding PCMH-type domain-containing protein n=1 Tax=Arthrobotrys oligospora (strain ATCC 24927 / CBS 115.81 / DSM 1491) TaxID=756982 RepID=G1X7L4_ARTOA|nr:hypothetical protein AOL_s00054g931 [Orbilia oligospora ATCC 24927]EGX50845.1 hypothetical protein AOL_s00054g931 [Orbilia oligospora ATCC 24927]
MHISNPIVFSIVGLMGQVAMGGASATATKACQEISKALPSRVSFPLSITYYNEAREYWSTVLRDLKPACVILPESALDVSAAVTILNKYPDVKFTARSGGHDPNIGHATVQDGVLISLGKISGTTYDRNRNVALVKPGGEWNEVIAALNKEGVTIVGGRLGIVGIGGFLLQGGISFLSSQYGLAADNVVGWEIVTANGTIINVNAADQPELAVALRGSGSQFGIVTQFTVRAYPIGKVWGGMRIYDESKADAIFKALHEFVPYNLQDKKAAIITTNIFAIGGTRAFIMFYFYDGETPPTTGPFADFLKIGSIIDITKTQTYPELLKSNGFGASLLNSRISFRTLTLPYIANNGAIYAEISDKMRDITKGFLSNPFKLTSQCSVDFQPLSSIVGQHTEARGGNAMGLTGSDPDRLILEIQCSWSDKNDDDIMRQFSIDLTNWIESRIPVWVGGEYGPAANVYLPLFMNDAMADQNVTGSYRDYAKFKALQLQADPQGILRTRTGGFKY